MTTHTDGPHGVAEPFGSVDFATHLSPDGVQEATVFSWALGRRADVSLFAPADTAPDAELPLVVLLHGVYGSHWAWVRSGLAHQTLHTLIASESIRPMVLAMPSDGLFGIGSGYLARSEENTERWIAEEVPQLVRLKYACAGAAGMAIAGLSMGGWGALRIAAKRPGQYRAAAGLSPLTTLQHVADYAVERHRASHAPSIADADLLRLLTSQAAHLPPLRITCGTADSLIGDVRALHAGLDQANIAHQYHESPGGHEWPVWEHELVNTLTFIDAHL
jgi:putative tributyrin esterase